MYETKKNEYPPIPQKVVIVQITWRFNLWFHSICRMQNFKISSIFHIYKIDLFVIILLLEIACKISLTNDDEREQCRTC